MNITRLSAVTQFETFHNGPYKLFLVTRTFSQYIQVMYFNNSAVELNVCLMICACPKHNVDP